MACDPNPDGTPHLSCCPAPDVFIQRVALTFGFWGHPCFNNLGIEPLYALRTNVLTHYPADPVNDGSSTHRYLCTGESVFAAAGGGFEFDTRNSELESISCDYQSWVDRNAQNVVIRRLTAQLTERVNTTIPQTICDQFMDETGIFSGEFATMRFVDQAAVANPTLPSHYRGGSEWIYECGALRLNTGANPYAFHQNPPGLFHGGNDWQPAWTFGSVQTYRMVKNRLLIFNQGQYFGCKFLSTDPANCERRQFFHFDTLHPPAPCTKNNAYFAIVQTGGSFVGFPPAHSICCNSAP